MSYISYDDKLQEVESILKTELNSCITKNNTAKPDLLLEQIPETNYLYNVTESANLPIFIILEVNNAEPKSINAKSAEVVFINIFIGFAAAGNKSKDNMFRAYRYESCIKAAFEKSAYGAQYKYESSLVDGLTIGGRAMYGAMCTFSTHMI